MNFNIEITVSGEDADAGKAVKTLRAIADALVETEASQPEKQPVGFVKGKKDPK